MYQTMAEHLSYMKYIDITKLLTIEDFYYTDTHWKQESILDVARTLASGMGVTLQAEYETVTLDTPFYGVYYGQLGLPIQPDTISYLSNPLFERRTNNPPFQMHRALSDGNGGFLFQLELFNLQLKSNGVACVHEQVAKADCEFPLYSRTNNPIQPLRVYDHQNQKEIPIYNMELAEGRDPYEMYLSGSLSVITIENPNVTTDKELVIFRDSFASSLAPLLVEGYAKITLLDIRYLNQNFIGNFVTFDNQDVLFLYSTSVINNETAF